MNPGTIRGNHYHTDRKEMLYIQHEDSFEFFWALADSEEISREVIKGSGAVLIEIPADVAHTIKNTGSKPISLTASSDEYFDPDFKGIRRRILVS